MVFYSHMQANMTAAMDAAVNAAVNAAKPYKSLPAYLSTGLLLLCQNGCLAGLKGCNSEFKTVLLT